jgi:hypothetical protein
MIWVPTARPTDRQTKSLIGGEGGVRRQVEKKEEEELKEKIDMKVSTKFQIHPSPDG